MSQAKVPGLGCTPYFGFRFPAERLNHGENPIIPRALVKAALLGGDFGAIGQDVKQETISNFGTRKYKSSVHKLANMIMPCSGSQCSGDGDVESYVSSNGTPNIIEYNRVWRDSAVSEDGSSSDDVSMWWSHLGEEKEAEDIRYLKETRRQRIEIWRLNVVGSA